VAACENAGMNGLGRRVQGSAGSRARRLGVIFAVLTAGLTFGVAPVVGDGMNASPVEVVDVPTVRATQAQVAASNMALTQAANAAVNRARKKNKKRKRRPGLRKVTIESRITNADSPIVTPEGKGTFVAITCPKGSLAISGGMVTTSINLLMSSSSNNSPVDYRYSPRKWYVAVTNVNVDGRGGALSWRGVVNCLSPAKLKR
jgi:hypothetical protein